MRTINFDDVTKVIEVVSKHGEQKTSKVSMMGVVALASTLCQTNEQFEAFLKNFDKCLSLLEEKETV